MLLALLACQSGKTKDHPDDETLSFPYDTAGDTSVPEGFYTTCDDGYVEQSRESVFGTRLCLAFTDVAQSVGLTNSAKHIGVYTFDYNDDGTADIFVSNSDAASVLYTLEDGSFTDVAEDVGLDEFNPNDVAPLDFDSDGDIDLAIAGTDGNFVLENSAGEFVAIDGPFDDLSGQTGKSVAWLGTDLVFGTDSGINYFNYVDGGFENVTRAVGIYDYDDVGAIAVGDIDDDGDQDFFAAKEVGTDRLFINEDSSFSDEFVEGDNFYPATQAKFVKLSDDDDLALSLTRNGSDGFLVCDKDYAFEDIADDLGLTSPNNTTSAIYADLTTEGSLSVYKTNHQSQNELLIRTVDDAGEFSYFYDYAVLAGVDFNEKSTGSASLDYDGDDREDVVTVAEDGAIHLIKNNSRFLE